MPIGSIKAGCGYPLFSVSPQFQCQLVQLKPVFTNNKQQRLFGFQCQLVQLKPFG